MLLENIFLHKSLTLYNNNTRLNTAVRIIFMLGVYSCTNAYENYEVPTGAKARSGGFGYVQYLQRRSMMQA